MRTGRPKQAVPWIAAGVLIPSVAHADVLWPALLVPPRMLSLPVIVLGFLIEATVLHVGFRIAVSRAALMTVVVNLLSTVLGFVAIPLAGIAWELFPGAVINFYAKTGTFNLVTWIATFVISVAITTGIEGLALRKIFHLALDRRGWLLWLGANAMSVSLVFASFALEPIERHDVYRLWLF